MDADAQVAHDMIREAHEQYQGKFEKLPYTLIHDDFQYHNVMKDGDELIVVDLAEASFAPRLFDIGFAILRKVEWDAYHFTHLSDQNRRTLALSEEEEDEEIHIQRQLQEYISGGGPPFSKEEAFFLPAVAMIR